LGIEDPNHLQAIAMIYTEPLKHSSIPTLKGWFTLKLYNWFTLSKSCSFQNILGQAVVRSKP